jgi:hypothetical protein
MRKNALCFLILTLSLVGASFGSARPKNCLQSGQIPVAADPAQPGPVPLPPSAWAV